MAAIKTKRGRTAAKTNTVGEMTIEELRDLIKETIGEIITDWLDRFESDERLEFTPEGEAELTEYLRERPKGRPMEKILAEMGITLDE